MIMNRLLSLLFVVMALLSSAVVHGSPADIECPQPRFTGKAPEPQYSQLNPVSVDRKVLKAAKKLYRGKDGHFGCVGCHGKKGKGDGLLAGQFDPRPRNFACQETIVGVPDGQLFWIIRHGSPETAMPAHPYYSDQQTWSLVLYLRTLAQ